MTISETIAAAVRAANTALPLSGYEGMHTLETLVECCASECRLEVKDGQMYDLFVDHFTKVYTADATNLDWTEDEDE